MTELERIIKLDMALANAQETIKLVSNNIKEELAKKVLDNEWDELQRARKEWGVR